MERFEPSYPVIETGKNVRNFVKTNKSEFWKIFKPLFPFIVGLQLLDTLITGAFYPVEGTGFFGGSILSAYLSLVLSLSWYRVVIHGVHNYIPMNPFKPQRHELPFISMGLVIGLGVFFLITIFDSILVTILDSRDGNYVLSFNVIHALACAALVIIIYFSYRISFYFPSKATDSDITLSKAYQLNYGYLLRLLSVIFLVYWRVFVQILIFYFLWLILVETTTRLFPFCDEYPDLIFFIHLLPYFAYFGPLLTVLGATVFSNYYLYAVQEDN